MKQKFSRSLAYRNQALLANLAPDISDINHKPVMEHKGNNNATNNGNTSTNNNNTENTQRDTNNNNSRDLFMPQSEPPGTSLPGSSTTSTPIVTSPLAAPVTTSSPTSSTNLTNVSPSSTNNSNNNNAVTTTTTTTTTTTNAPTPAATHKTQAAFVNKLYTMVEDQSIQHLISWAPSGDVFSVSNPTEFSKSVLPQYFKHNNWQSFVRQLNMYGFHKGTVNDMFHANPSSESQAWEFKHPDFRRGQLLALQNIKRKSSKPANPSSIKSLGNSGTGQSPSADPDMRDDRVDCLTNQMSEMMERMRQMSETYSLLYAETVSCRMLQSKHQQVITTITNLLASMSREDDSNDPRSLKRKFEMDLLTAEVAKLGQGDIPPPSHSPMMQHPSPHYPREHPTRSMSTPQPMVGLEHTSNMHSNSSMTEIEYRMQQASPFSGSSHRKVHTSSPLAMLPEIPFSYPSNNYLRHRSPEPISGVSPGNSRSASLDTFNSNSRPVSISQSSSHTASSQYSQTNSHSSHMSSLPSPPTRRSSQPPSSLSFGSDSNLLNPSENRYKDNNSSTISQSQSQQQRPPSSSSTSPTPFKSENPVVNNPSTSQARAPPPPDPPDTNEEYAKRRKRNN